MRVQPGAGANARLLPARLPHLRASGSYGPGLRLPAAATPGTAPLGRAARAPRGGAGAPGRGRVRARGDPAELAARSGTGGPRRGRGGDAGAMARRAEGALLLFLVSAAAGTRSPGRQGHGRAPGPARSRPIRLRPPGAPSLCPEVGKGWAGCGELQPWGFGKTAEAEPGGLEPVHSSVLAAVPTPCFYPWSVGVESPGTGDTFPGDLGLCLYSNPAGNMEASRGSSQALFQVRSRSLRFPRCTGEHASEPGTPGKYLQAQSSEYRAQNRS